MTGDRHVPFCGSPGVRFPRATRQTSPRAHVPEKRRVGRQPGPIFTPARRPRTGHQDWPAMLASTCADHPWEENCPCTAARTARVQLPRQELAMFHVKHREFLARGPFPGEVREVGVRPSLTVKQPAPDQAEPPPQSPALRPRACDRALLRRTSGGEMPSYWV